jgi:hypothetical protein
VSSERRSGPASGSARSRGQCNSSSMMDERTTSWAFREEPPSSGRPADDADVPCGRSCGRLSAHGASGRPYEPPCGGGPSVPPCGPSASRGEPCGEPGEPCDGPCDAPYVESCAPLSCVSPSVRTTFLEMVPMEHRFVSPIPFGCASRKFDPQLLGMACRDRDSVRSPDPANAQIYSNCGRCIEFFREIRQLPEISERLHSVGAWPVAPRVLSQPRTRLNPSTSAYLQWTSDVARARARCVP